MPELSRCIGPLIDPPIESYTNGDQIILEPSDDANETIQIPRGLLTWHSSFFAAKLDSTADFGDCGANRIQTKEKLEVLKVFFSWVYTRRLKDPVRKPGDKEYLEFRLLSEVWFFGDFYGIPSLKNAAIDMMHEQNTISFMRPSDLRYIYENTLPVSELRKFVFDSLSLVQNPKTFFKLPQEDMPTALVWDILKQILIKMNGKWKPVSRSAWAKLNRCVWHDHAGPGGMVREEGRAPKRLKLSNAA
ncbi:hypothetical protein EJ04DRAFT_575295 [Polyplosphaeria fusca]|uniref:BTB domain-containing protein n=1 Tax=Polyplosphaeria fusca TaxID=682080 RepID=A0A9P4V4K8_9PLEO|nr:hypothetical protein EJ04DRAFT_575295 [Polyplosphaeria fusca]